MDDQIRRWVALGREHYEKREYDRAEHYFQRVLQQCDSFADVHNMMGVIHHDRGHLEAARAAFERSLALNPRYTEAALNLVVTYNDLKRYADARRVYAQVLSFSHPPESIEPYAKGKIANLHAEIAQAYVDAGQLREAVEELRKAISLCPHFVDLRVRLANVYRQWEEPVAARLELEEAVRVNPVFVPARIALGVVLLMLGHTDKAVEQWQEAVKLEPENKAATMYLKIATDPVITQELEDVRSG